VTHFCVMSEDEEVVFEVNYILWYCVFLLGRRFLVLESGR
jgi:hypothetical protein